MATNKDRQGGSYERDSSSDTEDYHNVDERRKRVFKSRLRFVKRKLLRSLQLCMIT